MKSIFTTFTAFALALAGSAASAGVVYQQTFDTNTADAAKTLAQYGLTSTATPASLYVSGGSLHFNANADSISLAVGSFAGNLLITLDADNQSYGNSHIGISIGDNNFVFHPGYGGGAFRIEGPGGHGNFNMGYTPTTTALNHLQFAIDAATGLTTISITDGLNAAAVYRETFADSNYVAGKTLISLTAGGSGEGQFDNLVIRSDATAAVPEPASYGLVGLGLLGLAASRRRRSRAG